MKFFNRKPKVPPGRWPLDLPIAKFGTSTWTLADAFTGLLITGQPGSGKSSAVAKLFARNFLVNGMGGLVLCFKNEETATWIRYMKDAGREADTRVFGVNSPYRFNFLDFESKTHTGGLDFIDNLVNLLMDIVAIKKTAPVGNDVTFWGPQKKMLARNCLSLLLLAGEPLTLRAMNDLIQSSPSTLDEANSKEWMTRSYLYHMLKQANAKNPTHRQFVDLDNYWLYTRAEMDSETRAIINAEFLGMIDGPLSRGNLADLFGTTTNLDPSACFDGRVIIVDIPVEDYDEAGQYAALIWTTAFMRATRRRTYQAPHSRPVFLFADEAQEFSTDRDAQFHATSRSKGVACVRLTQHIPGFVRAYGGDAMAQITVDCILGALCTNIFLLNGDPTTNAWASQRIGKDTTYHPSLSNSVSPSGGGQGANTSLSPVEEFSCPEKEFKKLKNGGEANKNIVEGIICQAGRSFSGRSWMKGTFSQ